MVRETAHTDTAFRLTAIALLLRPMGPWFVQPVLLALAALVLIVPRCLHSGAVWSAVSFAVAIRIVQDWPLADNHIYLLAYWCLAIALWLRSAAPAAALAFTSRWLIGLAFTCAVVWKAVLSPDFLDQRFFRVTLQTDPRFAELTMLIGGLSNEQLEANRLALAPVPHGAALIDPPAVVEPLPLRTFAAVSTWAVLGLEAVVAVLMLLPVGQRLIGLRHAALLIFCCVTYAVAPVAGFGWLLLVIGLAQVDATRTWLSRTYVAAFLSVLFYSEVPWSGLLLDVLRSR
jgi:hypothetical protein